MFDVSIIGGMAITVFGVVLLVAGLLFRERFKDVPYGQKSIGFGVGIGGKWCSYFGDNNHSTWFGYLFDIVLGTGIVRALSTQALAKCFSQNSCLLTPQQ